MKVLPILFLSLLPVASLAEEGLTFSPYHYQAKIVSVYDGDTVTLDVDLGFSITSRQKIRLYGIDTPELRGEERPEGIKARDYLRKLCPVGSTILLKTQKDRQGKYGRYLGTLYKADLNVNQHLVDKGYATIYMRK